MDRFPLRLFAPSEWSWRVAGSALVGGQPIAGAPQTADASTGGWWVATWTPAMLTAANVGAWRAVVARLNTGVRLIEVPVLDSLQPFLDGVRPAQTTFTPGGDFSSGAGLITAPITAQLAAAAFMPAYPAPASPPTQAQIQMTTGAPLQGVEYFSVIGPSGASRMHMITGVWDVAADVYTVSITPPFREDMAAGTALDFNLPYCAMKLDVASAEKAWPVMTSAMVARPSIKFVESGFVAPATA
jgi:hypothetical protein